MVKQTQVNARVTLEKYLDELIRSVRNDIANLTINMNEKFEAQNDTRNRDNDVLEVRIEKMNELRDVVNSALNTLTTKDGCDIKMAALADKTQVEMAALADKTQKQETRQAFISGRDAALVGSVSVIFTVVQLLLNTVSKK